MMIILYLLLNLEDVGFIRDMCVDNIARNLNNELGLQPSSSCVELGKHQVQTTESIP